MSELSNRMLHRFFDIRLFRDVALKSRSPAAQRPNFGCQLFRSISVLIEHDTVCTFPTESESDRSDAGVLRAGY